MNAKMRHAYAWDTDFKCFLARDFSKLARAKRGDKNHLTGQPIEPGTICMRWRGRLGGKVFYPLVPVEYFERQVTAIAAQVEAARANG